MDIMDFMDIMDTPQTASCLKPSHLTPYPFPPYPLNLAY